MLSTISRIFQRIILLNSRLIRNLLVNIIEQAPETLRPDPRGCVSQPVIIPGLGFNPKPVKSLTLPDLILLVRDFLPLLIDG